MWNTDDRSYGTASDPLYQSCPLLIALRDDGSAHGLFFDNPSYSVFRVGDSSPEPQISFTAEVGPLCYYVLAGPTLKDVLQEFTHLTGRYPLPPFWSLGHQHSRWEEPESADRMLKIAKAFRAHRIPCDVLYLDIGHMDGYRCFTWNNDTFPDPTNLMQTLHAKQFKVVAITDPGLKRDPSWNVYQEGVERGLFCRDDRGEIYNAPVWPGPSAFPDFFSDEVRTWWGSLFDRYTGAGVDGFWNDMNEPSLFIPRSTLPNTVCHGDGARVMSHRSVHNCYGFLMARASYEGLEKLQPQRRPFLMTRSGFAGIQRYASAWTGDNRSNFRQYRLTVPMLLNMGLSGQTMVGVDIGGFWSHPSSELMARWIQLGAFYPFSRNHTRAGTPPQELWQFGDEVEVIARRYLELRYRFLPYLYTSLRESCRGGVPLMRPLFLDFPTDHGCFDPDTAESEFLIGPDLLVAPVLHRGKRGREVYLPSPCRWYEWWTGRVLEGGKAHPVEAPLDTLPLFVRCGAAIPMGPVAHVTDQVMTAPLTFRVIPDNRINGSLYIDDGLTVGYERGEYSLLQVTGNYGSGDLELEIARTEGSLEPMLGSHPRISVEMLLPLLVSEKLSVRLNNRVIESCHWQGEWLVVDDIGTALQDSPCRLHIDKE
jgi:alpha-glucosidase